MMRYSSKTSVEYDLKMHYDLREKYIEELRSRSAYENCLLKRCKTNKGKHYYSIRYNGSSKFTYVGDSHEDEVIQLQEYAYYKKAVEIIESNITLMEDFLTVYINTNALHINELLDATYTLPPFSQILTDSLEADEWLDKQLKRKARYPVFDPSGLKVTAFDGEKMRSRAEAFHYEAFFIYNIPAVFELPYEIEGEILRPDFTILDAFTMTDRMWEHLGNWFHDSKYKRDQYRIDSMHRIDEYAKIGFFPEHNLMLTFGSKDNIFDIQSLHRKISMFAAPPPSKETIDMLRRL